MKQRLMGSKKFWMVLVAILGVFILMASVLLLFDYSNKTVNNGYQQQGTYVEQPTTGEVDHSFEATKDRVDSINSNYGQQIKSAYSGETSAMEKMIQHRIVFSTIKNILLYAVLILMILLILVKGFNLKLFKKKLIEDGTEEKLKIILTNAAGEKIASGVFLLCLIKTKVKDGVCFVNKEEFAKNLFSKDTRRHAVALRFPDKTIVAGQPVLGTVL